ncbi:MAG: HAD-IA family hydrolase [Leptolyngbyaceae bacterium]|nr:HAD-IA family hydrolase [Leptolyngbyaceae bacterium]
MKVIIFDFDGTLADTLEPLLAITNRLAAEFGYPQLDLEAVHKLQRLSTREIIRESRVPVFKIPFLLRRLKADLHNEIHRVNVFPGIPQALSTLHESGYQLGIVTSNSTDNVNVFLKVHQLDSLFDFVHAGTTIFGKHRIIQRILKQRAIDVSKVLYVGDETRDIESAGKLPIQIASVTWGFNTRQVLEQHNPDYLIDHPQDLLHIVGAGHHTRSEGRI